VEDHLKFKSAAKSKKKTHGGMLQIALRFKQTEVEDFPMCYLHVAYVAWLQRLDTMLLLFVQG
jgi:hypothetical protein